MENTTIWANDPGANIYCSADCTGPPCECPCTFCEYCSVKYDNITTNNYTLSCNRDFCTSPPECSSVWNVQQINNGNCDIQYNTIESCWDGGDCCNSTCYANTLLYNNIARQTCGSNGYDCINPDTIEVKEDLPCRTVPLPNQVGNGWCDEANNFIPCWDGGDCCNGTCIGVCLNSTFDCLDPSQQLISTNVEQPYSGMDGPTSTLWHIIVGAVVGGVVLIAVIAAVIYFVVTRSANEIV